MKKKVTLFLCSIMVGIFLGIIPSKVSAYGVNFYDSGTYTASSNEKVEAASGNISYYSKPSVPTGASSCAWIMIDNNQFYSPGIDSALAQVGWSVDRENFSDNVTRYFFASAQSTGGYYEQWLYNIFPTLGSADGFTIKYSNGNAIATVNGIQYFTEIINWYPNEAQFSSEITDTTAYYPGKILNHEKLSNVKVYRKLGTSAFGWVYPGTLIWQTDTNSGMQNSSFSTSRYFEIWDKRN